MQMKKVIYGTLAVVLGVLIYMILSRAREGFASPLASTPVALQWTAGNEAHPKDGFARDDILLNDSYPLKWSNLVNMQDQWQKWWHYPTFKVGSYAQITNNIRWPNNPDIATCTRGEMCGALYNDYQYRSNVFQELPPVVVNTAAVRVNYYNAGPNMMGFVTNSPNVLY